MVAIFEGQASLARTASVAAADLIRQAIVEGRVAPGQRLKEEELAQQLGISRSPIREALLVLQTEGLLEGAPNRGATVRTYDVAALEEAAGALDMQRAGEVHIAAASDFVELWLEPRLPAFRELATRLDPRGAFRNAWLEERVF